MPLTRLEQLLAISSESLADKPQAPPGMLDPYKLGPDLFRMMQHKNGFFAFESALHVFPILSANTMSLEEWNASLLWRDGYRDAASGLLFFAEDAFQDQFCLSADSIVRFKAETGETQLLAPSIEEWADVILRDYKLETGWALASQWQGRNGPLPPGKRLMPKIPFFLGGSYSLDNLWVGDSVEGMRSKADLAMQTRDIADGSTVRVIVTKKPGVQ